MAATAINVFVAFVILQPLRAGSDEDVSLDPNIGKHFVSVRNGTVNISHGHICGGSIVSKRFVLTTFTCLHDDQNKIYEHIWIVAGTVYKDMITENSYIYRVSKVIKHPEFEPIYLVADIAILVTMVSICEDGVHTLRLQLPTKAPIPDQNCVTVGWGNKNVYGSLQMLADLYFLNQTLISEKYCPETDGYICAGYKLDVYKLPLEGDVGGPLICNGSIYGIISNRKNPYIYKYYVSVWQYRDWIENSTADLKKYRVIFLYLFLLLSTLIIKV